MKIILIHGLGATPEMHWFPWLKKELAAQGFEVDALSMPDPLAPVPERWVETLSQAVMNPAETVLVGHSLGCAAVLRYLASRTDKTPFRQIVLVSGFGRTVEVPEKFKHLAGILASWILPGFDVAKLKPQAENWVVIHSTDDDMVPFAEGEWLAEKLGAALLRSERGHFSEGVVEVPEILERIIG